MHPTIMQELELYHSFKFPIRIKEFMNAKEIIEIKWNVYSRNDKHLKSLAMHISKFKIKGKAVFAVYVWKVKVEVSHVKS